MTEQEKHYVVKKEVSRLTFAIEELLEIIKQAVGLFYENKEHFARGAVFLTIPVLALIGMSVIWLDTPTVDKEFIPMIILMSILSGVIITLAIGYVILRIFIQKMQDEES